MIYLLHKQKGEEGGCHPLRDSTWRLLELLKHSSHIMAASFLPLWAIFSLDWHWLVKSLDY